MTNQPTDTSPESNSPVDQLQYELELVDSFKAQFPEQAPILNHALDELKRRTGWGIPSGIVLQSVVSDNAEVPPVDELGHLSIDHTKGGRGVLQLSMPSQMSPDEFKKLNSYDEAVFSMQRHGTTAVGEVPRHARVMLDGLYDLTESQVVRDDLAEGAKSGVVIRRGVYHDEPIYFEEDHGKMNIGSNTIDTFQVTIVHGPEAEKAIYALSRAEEKEFSEMAGLDRFQAMETILGNDIDKRNFRDVAKTLHEASKAASKGLS